MNGKSIAGEEKKNNDKHLFYSLLYIFLLPFFSDILILSHYLPLPWTIRKPMVMFV